MPRAVLKRFMLHLRTKHYPGKEAEEHGQGEAIARNLMVMSGLHVPIIAVVTGEGSSGGALALGVANHILMLENAVYSVLSPEGAASIIWKDARRTEEASEFLKLTAEDLAHFGVVERVFPEGDQQQLYADLKQQLVSTIARLKSLREQVMLEARYQKFRRVGRD